MVRQISSAPASEKRYHKWEIHEMRLNRTLLWSACISIGLVGCGGSGTDSKPAPAATEAPAGDDTAAESTDAPAGESGEAEATE